jgi:hypothetical protein
MLKSAMVAMTILGCDCEQNTCNYVRTADLVLSSQSECQARMRSEIEKTHADYPLLVAACESLPEPAATAATAAAGSAADSLVRVEAAQAPAERSILVRARERYSEIMALAGDGLDGAARFATVPAGWLQEQIAAVQDLRW